MELRQLAHFVAVAEEQSFTRGAERMSIVQSGISVSIRALEREVGAELFDRGRTPVRLTDAGHALLPHAREALASSVAARDAVSEVRGGLRGLVQVGLMQFPSVIDVPRLVAGFLRARPGIDVRPVFAPGGSVDLVQMVVDGEIDVAVVSLPGGYPRTVQHWPLGSEEVMLACHEDHPLAQRAIVEMRELDGERFIDFPSGFGLQQSVEHLVFEAGIRRHVVVRVTDVVTIASLVSAGLGHAFLTRASVRGASGVRLVAVSPQPELDISLVYRRSGRQSVAARVFVEHVKLFQAQRLTAR